MQDVVMRFKVHMVKQLYYDLQKYDDERDDIGQVTLYNSENTTIEYHKMVEILDPFGYTGDAELYYLLPVPGINLLDGLKRINGAEDVKLMVDDHAKAGTKICHLYLVNRSESPNMTSPREESPNMTSPREDSPDMTSPREDS